MATYYDGLKDFFEKNDFSPLASSAQLVYLHLLQLNNRHGNRGFVQISDRELERLTNLNKNTITKAKRTLKNCKLIDFHTEPDKPHRGTTYFLTFFRMGQSVGQTMGQSTGQSIIQSMGQSVGQTLSNTPILSMDKDLRLETEDLKKSTITTIACANSQELDNIIDYWEQSRFGKLDFELVSKLESYVKRYGFSEVKAAMDAAKASNGSSYGVSFAYFASVLENRNKPKNLPKGGEENARTGTIERRKPKRNGNEEWRSFKV